MDGKWAEKEKAEFFHPVRGQEWCIEFAFLLPQCVWGQELSSTAAEDMPQPELYGLGNS